MCAEATGIGIQIESSDSSLEEGLLSLLQPAVETISDKIVLVLSSQEELGSQVAQLSTALDLLAQKQAIPVDIDHYTRNLANSKRRVLLLGSSVTSIQERLTRLQRQITLEIAKRKNILDTTPSTPVHTQDTPVIEQKQTEDTTTNK
ncbi:SNARE-associated protein Snapin-like [Oopsacas minuta]|uniref:Biogenesis of lysosome-related organelles complex 1 subunit 7 n=1 Tax=Oopsacas minuta TaxID=111878 RepID=A0AAV7JTB1_9METZ|nr:SNARE-associated protein Snapin-like [Oopsacas minuta]